MSYKSNKLKVEKILPSSELVKAKSSLLNNGIVNGTSNATAAALSGSLLT